MARNFRRKHSSHPIADLNVTNLIDLDDSVQRWLPSFRPPLADGTRPTITVRQLMNHTSGLSYAFLEPPESPYRALSAGARASDAGRIQLVHPQLRPDGRDDARLRSHEAIRRNRTAR